MVSSIPATFVRCTGRDTYRVNEGFKSGVLKDTAGLKVTDGRPVQAM
jgi:hypothetical protein